MAEGGSGVAPSRCPGGSPRGSRGGGRRDHAPDGPYASAAPNGGTRDSFVSINRMSVRTVTVARRTDTTRYSADAASGRPGIGGPAPPDFLSRRGLAPRCRSTAGGPPASLSGAAKVLFSGHLRVDVVTHRGVGLYSQGTRLTSSGVRYARPAERRAEARLWVPFAWPSNPSPIVPKHFGSHLAPLQVKPSKVASVLDAPSFGAVVGTPA